jgi:hypothetical protein
MQDIACNWTPQLIVEILKVATWPLTVLILGFGIRLKFADSIRSFFTKNSVSEVSATTTGISAKFIAAKQSSESTELSGNTSVSLPESMNLETLNSRFERNKTEFSEELYEAINTHLRALKLQPEKEKELLMKELSILQSALRFSEVSKVLFRSQFNLFSNMATNNDCISKDDVQRHFHSIQGSVGDAFGGWDWIKYVSYPVSSGLMVNESAGYKLSKFGKSYVEFMSRNPQLVDELLKL